MNDKFDGPLVSAFQTEPTGVIKQELITYRIKDGMLRKETTSRRFNSDQTDWHDSQSVDPMFKISEE
jgi:hypothetical protein